MIMAVAISNKGNQHIIKLRGIEDCGCHPVSCMNKKET
jgi:hypothetical protein